MPDWKQKTVRGLFKHFRQEMVVIFTGILAVSGVDAKDFGFYCFVCLFLWRLSGYEYVFIESGA